MATKNTQSGLILTIIIAGLTIYFANREIASRQSDGYLWFVAPIIAALLLAQFLKVLPSALIALAIGLLSLIPFGVSLLRNLSYCGGVVINPGVLTTFFGIFGAIIGGLIDNARRKQDPSKSRLNLSPAIIGLSLGFGLGMGHLLVMGFC